MWNQCFGNKRATLPFLGCHAFETDDRGSSEQVTYHTLFRGSGLGVGYGIAEPFYLRCTLQEIHNMLKENNKVLKCSNASPDWRGYVDFVNNVVVDGMSRVICASLEYLLDQVRLSYSAGCVGLNSTYHIIVTTTSPKFEYSARRR